MDVVSESRLHRALADEGRRRLLDVLAASPRPLDVKELGAALDLHPNTVRWHLRLLEEAGAVAGRPQPAQGRGRPRIGWVALRRAEPAAEYRLLASLLAGSLEGAPDGVARAQTAGRRWGEYLVERAEPGAEVSTGEATRRVVDLLAQHGFAPEAQASPEDGDGAGAGGAGGTVVALHACPYLDVASAHGAIVCGAHRGMIDGALAELRSPLRVAELRPLAGPGGSCLVRLAPGAAEPGSDPAAA